MTDEEYVMAHWDGVEHLPLQDYAEAPEEYWAAAAEFTRERLEQIRQLEADIRWATDARVIGCVSEYDMDAKRRTVARLESALADLRKGMMRP